MDTSFSKIPAIEQEDTKRDLVPYRGLQQINAQSDLRAKLLVQLLKVRVFYQDGIDFLMEACRSLRFVGMGRSDVVDELCQRVRLHSADTTGGRRESARTTHVIAGHRIVREGIRVLAMVIVAVHIVQTDCRRVHTRCHPGSVPNQPWDGGPPASAGADIRAAVIHLVLKPRRVGEEARQVRFVGTLQHTAGNVG